MYVAPYTPTNIPQCASVESIRHLRQYPPYKGNVIIYFDIHLYVFIRYVRCRIAYAVLARMPPPHMVVTAFAICFTGRLITCPLLSRTHPM